MGIFMFWHDFRDMVLGLGEQIFQVRPLIFLGALVIALAEQLLT